MEHKTQIPQLESRYIDPQAYHIVKTLQKRGFTTYLVGGCVRDLLLGKYPKDFDIATNAMPPDVRHAINNAFIIGRRFRIVLVKRGEQQFEVTTFRRDPRPDEMSEDLPAGDNIFGKPEEDAKRRDFTINALFYDPLTHELIDYVNGLADLKDGVVRMIGQPDARLAEDPIRIMRGIRLAHMIRFSLDPELRESIRRHAALLPNTALPRRREEILKFLRLENPALPFLTAYDLGVIEYISPEVTKLLSHPEKGEVFVNSLSSFHEKKLETPLELFAGLVTAVYFAENDGQLPADFHARDILENPAVSRMMRDELGMFKSEQGFVAKALQLMCHLIKRKDYERKGERRRQVLVSNEAFDLAIKIAEREHWLSGEDMLFWRNEKARLKPERSHSPRRRRRPPRKKAGTSPPNPS